MATCQVTMPPVPRQSLLPFIWPVVEPCVQGRGRCERGADVEWEGTGEGRGGEGREGGQCYPRCTW